MMRKKFYRPNFRLDPDVKEERDIIEYLKSYKSDGKGYINEFLVLAVRDAIRRDQSYFDFGLDDITAAVYRAVHDALEEFPVFKAENQGAGPLPFTPDELSREEIEASILDSLDIFGCDA